MIEEAQEDTFGVTKAKISLEEDNDRSEIVVPMRELITGQAAT